MIRHLREPDRLGPWSVVVRRLGVVAARGPMRRDIAEELVAGLGFEVETPFDFHRLVLRDGGREVAIAFGTEAVADLLLADGFHGADPQARWERARAELADVRAQAGQTSGPCPTSMT